MSLRADYYKKNNFLPPPADIQRKIYKRKLGKLYGLDVWLVDAHAIRTHIDVEFTMGGNGARYRYNPERELWIESNLKYVDAAATLLHEWVEFNWMRVLNRTMSYDRSHAKASKAETEFRKAHTADKNPNRPVTSQIIRDVEEWVRAHPRLV